MSISEKYFLQKKQFFLFLFLLGILFLAYKLIVLDLNADEGYYIRYLIEPSANYFDYIRKCYLTLNGRLIGNTLCYLFLAYKVMPVWRIISIISVLVIAYNVSRYYTGTNNLKTVNTIILLFFCCGFRILSSSSLWYVGAIFYLWPAAILSYILTNIADDFYDRKLIKPGRKYFLSLILGSLIMMWSEQCALLLLGFYFVELMYNKVFRKRSFNIWHMSCVILWFLFFLILMLAPAQNIRMNGDLGYNGLSGGILYFLQNSFFWIYDMVFVQQKYIVLLFGFIVLLCSDKSKNPLLYKLMTFLIPIPFISCMMNTLANPGYVDTSWLCFNIQILDGSSPISLYYPYIYWTIYTIVLIMLYMYNIKNPFASAIIFSAVFMTLVMMLISPTMYESGKRVGLIFFIGIISLIIKIMIEKDKNFQLVIGSFGIFNFLSLVIVYLKNGFIIYY